MPRRSTIGREELTVLRYITDHTPVTVAEVAKHFAQTAGLARTTILIFVT